MADCMSFPKEPMEFIKGYSFIDRDEVYTNGAELVPLFRVEQMLEHYHKPYKDKQEQGLLIELPCKVGTTVYLINHFMVNRKKKPIKCIVDELTIDGSGCYAILSGSEVFYAMQRFRAVSIKEFGKTVFTTLFEAESALAKMGGK